MKELNNSRNQSENTEKQNKKKEDIGLLAISQKDFIDTKLEKDLDFFSNYNFETNLFNDFSGFLKGKNTYSDIFLGLSDYSDSKKASLISQLKNEVLKVTASRSLIVENTKKSFLNNYELTSSEEENLYKNLKKSGNGELSLLSKYDSKRIDFLLKSKIFSSKDEISLKKKKINETLLNDIKISKDKFDSLSDEKKCILFGLYNFRNIISVSDLDIIINIFDDNQSKNNLVKYFFDSLSYSDLEKYNILTKDLESKIYGIFRNELKKISPNISEEDNLIIFESLDKDDFFVDIKNLDVDFSSLLSDKHFKNNLINKYNEDVKFISEIDKSIISKLTPKGQNEDINDSFISVIEKDESISISIRNTIKNFHENNIIKLSQTDSNGKTEFVYFKISKVDTGNNAFSKTIVLENITAEGGIKKDFKGTEKKFGYQGFYDLLKDYSGEKSKTSKFSIHTKKELEENGIQEIVPDNEINTLEELKTKLDFLDSDGKNIDFSSDKISVLDKKENFVYGIEEIKDGNIKIDQQGSGKTSVTLLQFYDTFKKSDGNLTRIKKNNNFDELLSSGLSAFSGLTLGGKDNDKLILESDKSKKELNNDKYSGIKYFVGENGEAIYIHNISRDKIDYSFGEVKEAEDPKNDKYNFSNGYESTSFTQFSQDISKFKMIPKHNTVKSKSTEELKGEKSLKGSFSSRFFSGMSIADLIVAAKFFPDTIKKNMERGNRLKALKFAQKVAKVSGSDSSFYLNMKSSAEQEEKNLTEEIIGNLKSLGSKDMIIQVKKILLNKNSEEYELIAAMMCIVGKYGTLYPKALKEFSGSMIWYRRLGGTDEHLYKEEEKIKNLKSPSGKPQPVFFNEERLVEGWLGERSKAGNIRSRIDKDFGNALAGGIKEEVEDGAMKAGNKVTTQGRVDYFIGELKNLGYPNAIGALEKIFGKNGPSQDMNAAPFILTITGLGEKLDQVLLNKIMGTAFTSPFTTLAFNSSNNDIDLYKNYIGAVIDDKFSGENVDKGTIGMKESYNKLINENDNSKKVELASKFWSTYGKYLINHINLSDPYTILKRNENKYYNDYFEKLKGVHSDGEFSVSDDDITYGVYDKNPIAYTGGEIDNNGNYLGVINKIRTDTTGGLGGPISKSIYNMYLISLENIKKDENSTDVEKKELFKEVFGFFSTYIKDLGGRFSIDSKKGNPLFDTMENRLGVTIQYDDEYPNREVYLDAMFEIFMNFKKEDVDKVKSNTKINIEETINKRAMN